MPEVGENRQTKIFGSNILLTNNSITKSPTESTCSVLSSSQRNLLSSFTGKEDTSGDSFTGSQAGSSLR